MNQLTDDMLKSSSKVNISAEALAKLAGQLKKRVGRFKV